MLGDPLSFLALLAYLGCVTALVALSARLASGLGAPTKSPHHTTANRLLSQRLALVPVFSAFFILPPGGLPPFFSFHSSLFAVLALFALGLLLLGAASPAARQKSTTALCCGLLPLSLFCGGIAFIAFERGLPGSPFGVEAFSALPIWAVVGSYAKVGLAVSLAGLLLCIGKAQPLTAGDSFAWYALRLAIAQTLLVMLLPPLFLQLAPDISPPVLCLLEFILRWLLAFLIAHGLMPLTERMSGSKVGPFLFALGLLVVVFANNH